MPLELSIDGIFVPGFLPLFLLAAIVIWAIDWIAGRLGAYRLVWNPPLFRLALLLCLFGAAGCLFIH